MLIKTDTGIKHLKNKDIELIYLDYFNNYLTVSLFAEHNGISYYSAKSIIKKGRCINHNK